VFYQLLPEGSSLYCPKNKNLKPEGDKASCFIIAADGVYMITTICSVRTTFFQAGGNIDVSHNSGYKE